MDHNQNLISTDLSIDPVAHAHLKETAMWAKFLAIVGFVLSIILVIGAMFAGTFMSKFSGASPEIVSMGAGVLSFIYIALGAVYFILSLFLFRFAVKMKLALSSNDQDQLNNSFLNLKYVYRIMGIIMVVYLGFMALVIIAGIGTAMMR